jgi:3-deoxy-D-manno-octulosonic acid kinase
VQKIERKNEVIWFSEQFSEEDAENLLNPVHWIITNKVVGSAKGRGTTWFVDLTDVIGALRHYRRGGLFGKLVADSYWFTGWTNTRCYQELELLNILNRAGVNTPAPLAARAIKKNLIYKADILTQKVESASDLVDILKNKPLNSAGYYQIGQEIRKMHDVGVNHTDLNIHNILLDHDGKVWLIDFDKCQIESSKGAWKSKNLERLKRSFMKERSKHSITWKLSDWDSLVEGYTA